MLKEKTTELLPSDPEQLEDRLTELGVAPEAIEHFVGVKAALESIPTWQRTSARMGHA
jgi:hypothetical protein